MFKKNFEDLVSILSQVAHNFRLRKFLSRKKKRKKFLKDTVKGNKSLQLFAILLCKLP